ARQRWAALAGAKAAVRATPRRDAVAPIRMMLPLALPFIAGTTCLATNNVPSALSRHVDSKSAAVMVSTSPQTLDSALYTSASTSPSSARMPSNVAATAASLVRSQAQVLAP